MSASLAVVDRKTETRTSGAAGRRVGKKPGAPGARCGSEEISSTVPMAQAGVDLELGQRDAAELYRTLLAINNATVSNLSKRDLFHSIATSIREILPLDRASITLFDESRQCFIVHLLETKRPPAHLKRLSEIPHSEESAVCWCFDNARYHVRHFSDEDKPLYADDRVLHFDGFRTIMNFPLIVRARPIGTLNFASKFPADYSETTLEFLSLVAGQIAIALDNANAYEAIRQLSERLDNENAYLQEEIKSERNFEEIVGGSAELRSVMERVSLVASTHSSVLITGETGTGKELIARAIHDLSPRKARPLIRVNCAALPAGLVESELFGHEKGAFTGATTKKAGRFELADGGTLFLDEVGDVPHETQVKLLRVLQERQFERVGGVRTQEVDVRVIAATNRVLEEAVQEGSFRSDLYYRLNVVPIHVPPLRERTKDIPLLAQYFVEKHARRMGRPVMTLSEETLARLRQYPWPGNVRELENTIERGIVLAKGKVLELENDFALTSPSVRSEASEPQTLEEAERQHILRALDKTAWVVAGAKGAARLLDVNPNTLRSRLVKLGIDRSHRDLS